MIRNPHLALRCRSIAARLRHRLGIVRRVNWPVLEALDEAASTGAVSLAVAAHAQLLRWSRETSDEQLAELLTIQANRLAELLLEEQPVILPLRSTRP